jgi:hypothetical protein
LCDFPSILLEVIWVALVTARARYFVYQAGMGTYSVVLG